MTAAVDPVQSRHRRALLLHGFFLLLCSIVAITPFLHSTTIESATQTTSWLPASSKHPHRNTTLVILLGNLRGGEVTWKTLYQYVLDLNHADLALMIGQPAPNSTDEQQLHATSLYQRATYTWFTPEYEDWAEPWDDILKDTNVSTTWRSTIRQLAHPRGTLLGGMTSIIPESPPNRTYRRGTGFRGSGAIIFTLRHFLREKLKRLQLTAKYSRFVLTRADHYYVCEHNISQLDSTKIWTPTGSDWKGVTDRHLVASADTILDAIHILEPVLLNPFPYKDILQAEHFRGNPEALIKRRWKKVGLWNNNRRGKFPRVMFTCAVPGDTTRWQVPGNTTVREGVLLKYENEYVEAKRVCSSKNG